MLEGEDEDKIILSLKGLRNIENTLRYIIGTHGVESGNVRGEMEIKVKRALKIQLFSA